LNFLYATSPKFVEAASKEIKAYRGKVASAANGRQPVCIGQMNYELPSYSEVKPAGLQNCFVVTKFGSCLADSIDRHFEQTGFTRHGIDKFQTKHTFDVMQPKFYGLIFRNNHLLVPKFYGNEEWMQNIHRVFFMDSLFYQEMVDQKDFFKSEHKNAMKKMKD
jgi:hypothetical protein